MGFRLLPHISYCRTAHRTIILDLKRDWYYQLEPRLADYLDRLTDVADPAPDDADLQRLMELGLVAEALDQPTDLLPVRAARPNASCFNEQAQPFTGFVSAAEVWWSVDQARRRLRKRPLDAVILALRLRKSVRGAAGPADHSRLKALARSFNRRRREAAVEPICLQDSLALLDVLARRGLYPDLIIGVNATPFLAHAWVQTGDLVLNDAVDEVRTYQPILVV